MANWDNVWPFTLGPSVEGGYQCDERDSGNWTKGEVGMGVLIGTNGGISAPILVEEYGEDANKEKMQSLTKEEIVSLAKKHFYDKMLGDKLPAGVDLMVFDMNYNTGSEGTKVIQDICFVTKDGVLGEKTLAKFNELLPHYISVTNGTDFSIKLLQSKLGVRPDGTFGPVTTAALRAYPGDSSSLSMCCNLYARFNHFYTTLRTFAIYGNGWVTRNENRLRAAFDLVKP